MQSKKRTILLFLLTIVLVSCSNKNVKVADLVMYNGIIQTLDDSNSVAEAIAVRNDTVIYVGMNDSVKQFIGDKTKKIDMRGRFLIPGFNDAHLHFISVGKAKMNLELQKANNWDEIIFMVAKEAEKLKPGEWIIGRGWHQEKWDPRPEPSVEGYPVHDLLSKATTLNPVLLTHASGHALFANAKAMELAGITDSTKSPEGGRIVRDSKGKAIGVFEENAEELIRAVYNKYLESKSEKELKDSKIRAIELATEECLKFGITSVTDAGSSFNDIDLFKELIDKNKMKIRLNAMLYEDNKQLEKKIAKYKIENYGNHYLRCMSIKRYADGALGSRGALMLAEYSDLPGHFGQEVTSKKSLLKTADIAVKNGFQLCVHAIGDKGNRNVLDIYRTVFDKYKIENPLRWRIEHAQHLSLRDIPRFSKLGVIASMQGIHCTSDAPFVVARLGSYRAKIGAYPWRKLLDNGAIICNGTDAPIESVNTFANLYALITRKTNSGRAFYPEQAMTRLEALKAYTVNGAYASFEEKIKGSLEKGKLGDMILIDNNLLTCPEEKIKSSKVLLTVVGGKIVYRSGEFANDK